MPRTKITVDIDIAHELPLAVGPGTLTQYIEAALTRAELLGQRDPKLSVRATVVPEQTGENILVAGMLLSHAGELDKLAEPRDDDKDFIARHRRNMAYMAELARAYAERSTRREPRMQPTDEQLQAIELFMTGESLAIEAGAGTGKTSTLVLLAEAAGSRRRGQYLAFNKSLVDDSAGKFPLSVASNTAHSLAYRGWGHRYGHRLRSGERVPGWELAKRLRLSPIEVIGLDGRPRQLAAGFLAGHATRAIARYCQTADEDINVRHFPYIDGIDAPDAQGRRTYATNLQVAQELLPTVDRMWADLEDPQGWLVPYKHEHYLKQWQLTDPRIDADYVLFDEAQDANPVIAAIVAAQAGHAQLVYVGDAQQEIYAWTGAVNALAQVEVAHRSYLSQSFRFGQAIADEANIVLTKLDAVLRLTGNPAIGSRVETVALPKAILTRTNAHGIERLLELQRMGRAAHYLGGSNDVLGFAKAARELQDTGHTGYPELACFAGWAEVLDYVAHDEDGADLGLNVRLVEKFGVDAIIEGLQRMVPEARAEVVISTAHKSKGRQWESVQIAPDFRSDPEKPPSPEALRLLYVALTRAQVVLDRDAIGQPVPTPDTMVSTPVTEQQEA